MTDIPEPDLLVALAPVLDALGQLDVRHFVGGSIASSAHGVPRASIDADVVAELRPPHATPLIAALRAAYYVPEERVASAISRRESFNVIHLATMVKIDVFVSQDRPFDRQTDVTGLLRVADPLDHAYLAAGARAPGLADLLSRALDEANHGGSGS